VLLHKQQILDVECEFSSIHNYLARMLRKPPPDTADTAPPEIDHATVPITEDEEVKEVKEVKEGCKKNKQPNHTAVKSGKKVKPTAVASDGKDSDKDKDEDKDEVYSWPKKQSVHPSKKKKKTGPTQARHRPTYPFDFAAAVVLTDMLMEQLPPAALLQMADPDLKHLIVESK
jgi:hypothetical protein